MARRIITLSYRRASEIGTETYPREEQSLNPKIRATKLVWVSLYSSLSIKQQFDRIEASAGGALAGFQGDAGIEVLRCVKSRQQNTETVVALISIELFHLNSTLLTSETRRKHPKPRSPRKLCHSRPYRHFPALCSCVLRGRPERLCPTIQATLSAIRSSPDREIHLSSYRIYLHPYICTYDCARGCFSLSLGERCPSAAGITHRLQ